MVLAAKSRTAIAGLRHIQTQCSTRSLRLLKPSLRSAASPLLDDDLRFLQAVEDFAVQQLIA